MAALLFIHCSGEQDKCESLDFQYNGQTGCDGQVYPDPATSPYILPFRSVAEITFGHIISLARSIYLANQTMPVRGSNEFNALKKDYGGGMELYGRTLGIIGFGKIGQETAQVALGVGMTVKAVTHT